MPHIARDTVVNYYPTQVSVSVIQGTREATLVSAVNRKGLVNDPKKGASALPITYLWEFGVITGGANAAILSPTSPTTKIRVLNPGDTLLVTLTVTTAYDTAKTQVTITVPPA